MIDNPPRSDSELDGSNGSVTNEIRLTEGDIQQLLEEGDLQIRLINGDRNVHPTITIVGGSDSQSEGDSL